MRIDINMNLDSFALFLTALSGICWTIVYLDSIRLGFRDRTYAIPFWALALNATWEVLHAVIGYQQQGFSLQNAINALWFILDVGILYTYFRFGKKHFPESLQTHWFYVWSFLGFLTALLLQYFFIIEFGLIPGAAYSAFLQNLLMSVLFINMLVQRRSSEGQSLTIGISKWLGTLAPTILFGFLGLGGFGPSPLVLVLGIFCSIFDLIYIWMLAKVKTNEKRGASITILL